MEKIYISPNYLKVLHYYFFSNSIISLTFAFINAFSGLFNLFLVFYILHTFLALYMSKIFELLASEKLIISRNLKDYAIIALISIFIFIVSVIFYPIGFIARAIILINYYIFALSLIWYVLIKLGVPKKLFRVYDFISVEKAKNRLIKEFNKKLDLSFLENYKALSDSEIDLMILSFEKANLERKMNLIIKIASRIYLGKRYEREFYKEKLKSLDRNIQKILQEKSD